MNWYPTIGLGTKDEMVTINLGQDPFMFKIDYVSGNDNLTFNEENAS